jgi:hypothetical protein
MSQAAVMVGAILIHLVYGSLADCSFKPIPL